MNDSTAWAQFGDAGGRHGLVDSEGIDDETLRAIRWHTDQPPEAPSQWPAYFAGYPIGDHYVVQFTQPDHEAGRPGMVKTTLTAVHAHELSHVSLPQLRSAARRVAGAVATVSSEGVAGLGAALELLATSQPVYWLGTSSFDVLVDQLWDVFGSHDRASLVFGMLFSPARTPYPHNETTAHGVYLVPEQLRARFSRASIIEARNPPPAGMLSSAMLANATGIAPALGIDAPTLRQWPHLVEANRHYDNADSSDSDGLRACAHLVTLLAPEPEQGKALKAQLGTRIVESSADAPYSHIRGMRTLKLADLGVKLDEVVEPWIAAVIADPNRFDDLEVALAEVASIPQDSTSAALDHALSRRIATSEQQVISYFEAALAADSSAVFSALALRCDRGRVDPVLASLGGIGSRHWVHDVARQAHLPLTHGRACPVEKPIEAFRSHLSIAEHSRESCAHLAARCPPQSVVEAAIDLGAAILLPFAVEAVHRDSDALLPARPASPPWQEIWAGVVESGADPWRWLKPTDAVVPVLDAAIGGSPHSATLVAALSEADGADISHYPRRAEVWDAIKGPPRSRLLRRTAIAVILNGSTTANLEPALRKAVLSIEVMAEAAAIDISAAVDALEHLAVHANADIARAVAKAADLGTDADRYADLVIQRHWVSAARYVVQKASKRPDFASIADRCRRVSHSPVLDMIEAMWALMPRPAPKRPRDDPAASELDVLIVTAIKAERKAVRKHLSHRQSRRVGKSAADVGVFEGRERLLRVAVIEVGPGNIGAASLTAMAVSAAQPEIVLMVGIAGGVKDLAIGDVVASSKIYWAEAGKSEAGHATPRPGYGPVSSELVQVARSVAADDEWQARRQSDGDAAYWPSATVAPIVVGEEVVASSKSPAAKRIKALYGDAVAVAMEDVGVTTAADLGGSKGLAIRAISDLLDDKAAADASGSQEIAADHAAAFAFELLTELQFLPLEAVAAEGEAD